MVLFAAQHVNTCVSYTCKSFVFHRENNIILDWNDVGVSKPWSLYSLVIIVLIIPRFGWKIWAMWAWPSVRSSGRYSRTDRLLALLWCCAVQFRFQAVDVWNAPEAFLLELWSVRSQTAESSCCPTRAECYGLPPRVRTLSCPTWRNSSLYSTAFNEREFKLLLF